MGHYPSGIDTFDNPTGSDTLSSPDHATLHREVGSAVIGIQTVLGTNSGTSILKNFTAGEFAAKNNNDTFGTPTIIGGTIGTAIVGTSNFIGGTVQQAVIGTNTIQGGTIINPVIGTPAITGGTYSSPVLGTPTVDFFTSSGTALPSKANRGLAPTVGTLDDVAVGSSNGTIAINAALANVFELTLGTTAGTRVLAAPSNPTDGQVITIRIKQNAGATGTLGHNAIYRFSSDIGTPALGTAATWNYFSYRYNATDTKHDFQGQSLNII